MALNIKNADVGKLLAPPVQATGESKTKAVRQALAERQERLARQQPENRLRAFLQDEVWPQIPEALPGTQLRRAEEEAILGYGEQGI